MRALIWLLISAALILAGNSRASTNSPATDGKLITTFGSYSAVGGLWTIKVPGLGGKLEVARGQHVVSMAVTNPITKQISYAQNAFMTNTVSSDSWRAHTNWFVFVENDSRVWSYDGKESLDLLLEDAVGASLIAGPCAFPCEVPEPVRSRLPESVRRKLTVKSKLTN